MTELALPAPEKSADRPTIVCLCGSTRFWDALADANLRETAAGRIVLAPGVTMKTPHPMWAGPDEAEQLRARLDPAVKDPWQLTQWIKSREDAYRQADNVALAGCAPVVVGIGLWSFAAHGGGRVITPLSARRSLRPGSRVITPLSADVGSAAFVLVSANEHRR
jgi:hypothetical protein